MDRDSEYKTYTGLLNVRVDYGQQNIKNSLIMLVIKMNLFSKLKKDIF